MKARIICTYSCPRSCEGCCNKDWPFEPARPIERYTDFNEILLTGGEPLMFPERLWDLILQIRKVTKTKIYIYTAAIEMPFALNCMMKVADGICLTLHTPNDIRLFNRFQSRFPIPKDRSMRLNIFEKIGYPKNTTGWAVKKDIRWLKQCPLPQDEILYKLPILWTR